MLGFYIGAQVVIVSQKPKELENNYFALQEWAAQGGAN